MKKLKKGLSLLLAICMMLSLVIVPSYAEGEDSSVAAASLTMGTKPADGTTTGNPFVQGTGGSNSFRIPAMVTLNNGTLVAAADARWNTTYDGGGLDTIVSYSADNGANWNYTFANYLGDNGNVYNGSSSTAFIDPALATDGSTVYMLCDLYPYGVALNGSVDEYPSTDVGFNNTGKLLLSGDNHSSYGYYLDGGKIYSTGGAEVSGLTVDAYFNVSGTYNGTTYNTNLFFSDSPFKVVRTGYLYLTKSVDGGKTWSAPTLIPNVKTSSEQVCLVGPGRGLVTGGKIIFPVYSYNGGQNTQRMGFIYSSDNGANWTRVDSSINWSSESAVVELENGTLRFFYRNGNSKLYYVDYSWTNGWGNAVNTGIATNSNTQISAISYSKTVGGKQVILVSCPTGPNEAGSNSSSASNRLNGKIFVGYVNSDNTMSWQSDKAISVTSNDNQFMYSCLTELSDGKVAILYENKESAWGTGDNCYYTMAFATYDLGLTFDTVTKDTVVKDEESGVSVNFGSNAVTSMTVKEAQVSALAGKTYVAYDITPKDYTGPAEVTIPLTDALKNSTNLTGFVVEDGSIKYIAGSRDGDNYTFTTPHFSVMGVADLKTENIELTVGESKEVPDDTGNYVEGTDPETVLDDGIATVVAKGSDGTASVQEWQLVTNGVNGITTTDKYLIVSASSGSAYALTSSGGTTPVTITDGVISVESVSASSNAVFTFEGSGSSWAIKGTTGYLYPTASRSNKRWSYTLTTGNSNAQTVTISGTSGVTVSRGVTSKGNSTTSYLTLGSTAKASGSSDTLYLFKLAETAAADPSTTITFTGVSAGTTSVIVGDTLYNITVNRKTQNVNLSVGNSATYNDASKSAPVVENSSVASATLADGKLTIKGLKDGTTTITTDTTVYTVTVSEGTPISIKENETATISVTLQDGQTVEWSSADSNYVGVAGKYDTTVGAYTNEALLAGQNVTDSPVVVTATIKDKDGNVVGTQKWLVTVTKGDADTNASSKGIYFNIATIEHCTVYYSINGGELIPVNGTGVTTGNWTGNGTYKGHFNIMFFAAPEDGYALTCMSISGSADQYYTLSNGNPDGTGSDAWPFNDPNASTIPSNKDDDAWKTGHGFRWSLLEGNMTIDQMKVLFSNAIALGCDGATTITKNGNDGMGSASNPTVCKFVAQKLPTVDKTIKSITRDGTEIAYTDGMKVKIGDTINYSVVVTRYATNATYGTITYDNEVLTDDLTNNQGISSPDMGTSTTSDKTYTYTTSLTLTQDNFGSVVKNGTITNVAEFRCSYSSQYSAGSLDSTASVTADITVDIPNYVVDFGLPVEINLTGSTSGSGRITRVENGVYGTAAVNTNGTGFTYTPNKILQDVDYVQFTYKLDGSETEYTYQVAIYPATTVYYEEGFATYSGSWTGNASKGSGTQTAQVAGESTDEYGYDKKYGDESAGASNGSQAVSEYATSNPSRRATFTFTGTGVDIYANTSESSGCLMVKITKAKDGSSVKLIQVDTHMANGTTEATTGQAVKNAYNVPVVSVTGLAHDTYNVEIRHIGQEEAGKVVFKQVALDGFRVYGTLATEPDFYKDDLEDNPTFIELRDQVLYGLSKSSADDGQVNAALPTDTTVAVVASSDKYTADNVNDLLENGPKNEIYLQPGMALVLNITTDREVQIGLKALNAETTYTINDDTENPIKLTTSTDMFYTIGSGNITITNNGSGILAITKLKVCDDPTAALAPLTEEDLTDAYVALGIIEGEEPTDPEPSEPDPEEPTDPEEPETPVDPEPEPTPDPEPEQPAQPSWGGLLNALREFLRGFWRP